MHVNWGGTYGTDTYYTNYDWADENLKYFNIGKIGNLGETPTVAGKMPLFFYDEACTQLILDDWNKTNFSAEYDHSENSEYYWFFNGCLSSETDGATVYVQWEDAETVYREYGNR